MSLRVTPILGVVKVLEGGALVEARPAGNSTRWMFDVEGSLEENSLILQLIEMRSGRESTPDLASCAFLPRSPAFYDVRPFLDEQTGGRIVIRHANPGDADRAIESRYRVMIDVLHTATR